MFEEIGEYQYKCMIACAVKKQEIRFLVPLATNPHDGLNSTGELCSNSQFQYLKISILSTRMISWWFGNIRQVF